MCSCYFARMCISLGIQQCTDAIYIWPKPLYCQFIFSLPDALSRTHGYGSGASFCRHDQHWNSEGTQAKVTEKITASGVGVFTRWLQRNHGLADVRIEYLEPADLDSYLSRFFSTVKTRDEGDYLPKSFKNLREALVRHLKHHGYPHLIVSSPLFGRSRMAFKDRMNRLKTVARDNEWKRLVWISSSSIS